MVNNRASNSITHYKSGAKGGSNVPHFILYTVYYVKLCILFHYENHYLTYAICMEF